LVEKYPQFGGLSTVPDTFDIGTSGILTLLHTQNTVGTLQDFLVLNDKLIQVSIT